MPYQSVTPIRRMAIIGSYIPRQCGIATFTHDLYSALAEHAPHLHLSVVAVSDEGLNYDYPTEVERVLQQSETDDYACLAQELNQGGFDRVCLQHEYGIFGGVAGEDVILLIRSLQMPVITTLHTVLDHPSEAEHRVMAELIAYSAKLVVMSRRGQDILTEIYGAPRWKVEYVPHGAHDLSKLIDEQPESGEPRLLTFGLLSPDKGIENVIKAMPAILEKAPDTQYVVAGATHPKVKSYSGEAYRNSLIQLADDLGVSDHIQFLNKYASLPELAKLLSSANIYITPYLKPQQITSGTLAYAMGCGRAIISTPYIYAQEVLADGRGVLVPFADPQAIANEAISLLTDRQRRQAIQAKAFRFGRTMFWPLVACRYLEIMEETNYLPHAAAWTPLAPEPETVPLTVPRHSISHLMDLSDDTGLLQHATFNVPNFVEGYCVCDNARALLLPADCDAMEVAQRRNLAFLSAAFNHQTGRFRNFMSFNRRWLESAGSEDSHGRAVWGLGVFATEAGSDSTAAAADHLFFLALPVIEEFTSPRAMAFALLGITAYMRRFGFEPRAFRLCEVLSQRLEDLLQATVSGGWPWFENSLAYDNARIPQALLRSSDLLDHPRTFGQAREALEWLADVQMDAEGRFEPVGSDRPFTRGEVKPRFDQQPVDVWASISAYLDAGRLTGEKAWVDRAEQAYRWFLGSNCHGMRMFEPDTGGGYDGLRPCGVNRNQGAESTLAFLLATEEIKATRTEPALTFDRFALV